MTDRIAQEVDWGDYTIFDPGVDRPLAQLPRREARTAYERLMVAKPARIAQVRALLDRNGIAPDDHGAVDRWFYDSVEENPSDPGRLAGIWYSVVNDLGLNLGEHVIAETDGALHWEMVTSPKKDFSYQRHVIRGFDVENPRYYADFDLVIGINGHRIVRGRETEPGLLQRLVDDAMSKAGSEHGRHQ